MAMSRRIAVLVGVLWGLLLLPTCSPRPSNSSNGASNVVAEDAPRRAGVDAVLVFLPESPHTREAWATLKDELGADFDVITRRVPDAADENFLQREIEAVRPSGLVLMGNLPMNLYLRYQRKNPSAVFPPAVVVMASFFDEQRSLFKNTTGIAYEVPGITSFVSLRSFVHRPVRRVGVLYRPLFANYVKRQAALSRVEQVELVPVEVSVAPGPYEIRRAIDGLTSREKVDAIWVLNDNALLEPELIAKGWLKMLHKTPVVVVVGVGSLVDTRLHFGSFAVLPDHAALGVQTANLIFRLAERGWSAEDEPVELPFSVQTVVDLPWTREHFQFREEAIERIDRIVQ
ncbi:MAG TPA: hypothetical protein VG937_23285 [Polyangiaceae bacterium]|nr:hypothetical protein [Polyangiaceae bacterium]